MKLLNEILIPVEFELIMNESKIDFNSKIYNPNEFQECINELFDITLKYSGNDKKIKFYEFLNQKTWDLTILTELYSGMYKLTLFIASAWVRDYICEKYLFKNIDLDKMKLKSKYLWIHLLSTDPETGGFVKNCSLQPVE
jgi:hypothetical protein